MAVITSTTVTRDVVIPQYSPARVLGTWAAAALPMAGLAWVGAPALAARLHGSNAFPRALILALGAGLLWQLVLVLWLVQRLPLIVGKLLGRS